MPSSLEFTKYVCDQIQGAGAISYRKLFGEFAVYCNLKPIFLIIDDRVYVKIHDVSTRYLAHEEQAIPFEGARLHYCLQDVDNREMMTQLAVALEEVTPLPKRRSRKRSKG